VDVSGQDDARLLRDVRAAGMALGEHPSARVREAVLGAARAAAAARPGRAQDGSGAPGNGARRSAPWSYALAASVLAGAVAFLVFQQMQGAKAPTLVASASLPERKFEAAEPVGQAAAPSPPVSAPPVAAGTRQAPKAPPAMAPQEAMEKQLLARAAKNSPLRANVAFSPEREEEARKKVLVAEQGAAKAKLPQAEMPPRNALAKARADLASPAAAQAAAGSVTARQTGGVQLANQATSASPVAPSAFATDSALPVPQAPAAAAPPPGAASQTPKEWIDRIVALRRTGRQDEADRELAALRKRYPDIVVPASALRPPG
jgi:hypothetical protein